MIREILLKAQVYNGIPLPPLRPSDLEKSNTFTPSSLLYMGGYACRLPLHALIWKHSLLPLPWRLDR